ncbi:(Fe-S)-binding protein [Spirosoma sp. KUDC1026]|uniref:(Fe-S)-binding protein n=1 Tax=Spirosoma sp. KUDC1026 TaxID=2745947 RepID=UPI00159BB2B4|nr:(Fe-S)-binding protein [Spirosoma sp. KUDC1026]QKZ14579.1 (Fe-S)-binding protein [Spirosoma sp. KUDC1026]
MNVALFIPCYVDQFYPQVGIATMRLLEKVGVQATFPMEQTCCGQPMANAGCERDSIPVYQNYVRTFADYDYIVAPSGSCVYHVRKHFDIIEQTPAVKHVRERTFELVQFLTDVVGVTELEAEFPYRVGIHQSCHGLRGLRLASDSEMSPVRDGKLNQLLRQVKGLELVDLKRYDECCGFGGAFCVSEAAVSARMGQDRVQDHVQSGAQVITGGDMSCLMHMEGIVRRQKLPVRVMHVAEILTGSSM